MEENIKFIRLESNYLKKFLKWFMGGASNNVDRPLLQSILCKNGVFAVSNGFMIYEWDFQEVETSVDQFMSFVLGDLKKLEGIYRFEIHGKFLVISKQPMETSLYPDYEKILHVGCLSFTKTDYEKMDLDVARIFFDPNQLKKLLSFPLPELTQTLLQIGRMISVRYEHTEIGKLNLLLMPMMTGSYLPISTLGPSIEGDVKTICKHLERDIDSSFNSKYKESRDLRGRATINENPA